MKTNHLIIFILLIAVIFFFALKPTMDDQYYLNYELVKDYQDTSTVDEKNLAGNAYGPGLNIQYNSCIDSDGGKKYLEPGEVSVDYSYEENRIVKTLVDKCKEDTLYEYYCNKNKAGLKTLRCRNGCFEGHCVEIDLHLDSQS